MSQGSSAVVVGHRPPPVAVVVMGVSGSGKSTVGLLLAARLRWRFEDGDRLHPVANIDKMRRGIALTDVAGRGLGRSPPQSIGRDGPADTPLSPAPP